MENMNYSPCFGVGEACGVREYVETAFPALCNRLGLCGMEADSLMCLGLSSLESAASLLGDLNAGMVHSTAPAREFWNAISKVMVSPESELYGLRNLQDALARTSEGANVLVIQNHTSGADTMVMEALINRELGYDATRDWAYMSGHAVNLFLIPLMFTAAVTRFQIFSVKYRSMGLAGNSDADMARQNMRALRALQRHVAPGGKVVAFYPEGGRGEGCLKRGEPRTTCIPEVMSKASKQGLWVLPTYVSGATNLLPVSRGTNEYNEIFANARRGTASLTVGQPVRWEDLQPSQTVVVSAAMDMAAIGCSCMSELKELARQRLLSDTMLGLIANLAPTPEAMGPYADPELRTLSAQFAETSKMAVAHA